MIRESLGEALARMVDTPVLWITGLYPAALFALVVTLESRGYTVLGARAGFLGLCALPLFLGGAYGALRGEGKGIRDYFRSGAKYFTRILLAGAVIFCAALLTAFLVMVPVMIMGGDVMTIVPLTLLSVTISFAIFTFFSDTAVAFEDRKVLDSIRRSVEFVTGNTVRALLFYLVNLGIALVIFVLTVGLWSFTIADRLEPYVGANQTVFQNMTAPEFVAIVGVPGLQAGIILGFFGVLIGATLLVTLKACYFRRAAPPGPAAPVQGEFDEKGRWYRY
jgi:hypothetical protein